MAADPAPNPAPRPAVVGRRGWHPLTVAGALAAAAVAAAALELIGAAAAPLALWLVMGAVAGFATSGST